MPRFRPFQRPSSRLTRTAAAAALAASGALAAVLLPAAAAQAATTSTHNAYSTDLHARTHFTVTFYGTQHALVVWTNADLKADGRGAIMFVGAFGLGEVAYDHVLSGANTSDTSTTDIVLPGPLKLDDVWVKECNGGSHDSPQRCDTVRVDNTYH